MAKVTRSEAIIPFSSKDQLPKLRYTCRCISQEFGPNKAQTNPQLVLEWEIVMPETVQIGDRVLTVAGVTFKQYFPTYKVDESGERDVEASKKAIGRLLAFLGNLGLPNDEIDDEQPDVNLEGFVADFILSGKPNPSMRAATADEKAEKPGLQYVPITDENGKPVISYQTNVNEVLGPSSVKVGESY